MAGSEYIESDTVFAVKKSLVVDFDEVTDPALAEKWKVNGSRSGTPTSTSSCSREPKVKIEIRMIQNDFG